MFTAGRIWNWWTWGINRNSPIYTIDNFGSAVLLFYGVRIATVQHSAKCVYALFQRWGSFAIRTARITNLPVSLECRYNLTIEIIWIRLEDPLLNVLIQAQRGIRIQSAELADFLLSKRLGYWRLRFYLHLESTIASKVRVGWNFVRFCRKIRRNEWFCIQVLLLKWAISNYLLTSLTE